MLSLVVEARRGCSRLVKDVKEVGIQRAELYTRVLNPHRDLVNNGDQLQRGECHCCNMPNLRKTMENRNTERNGIVEQCQRRKQLGLSITDNVLSATTEYTSKESLCEKNKEIRVRMKGTGISNQDSDPSFMLSSWLYFLRS